jgi:GxxExxY protein
LGPGFNEKIYNNALRMLFEQEGIQYQTEKQFDVIYSKKENWELQSGFGCRR